MTRQARSERDDRPRLGEAPLAEVHGGDRVLSRLK